MAHVYQIRDVQHSSDDREPYLAAFERDLVTTLGLLDDIRRNCIHAGDDTAASLIQAASEMLIAFANIYLCRRT